MEQAQEHITIHKAVRSIITDEFGRILVGLRPPEVSYGNMYILIGGKVDTEESISVALDREIHEELGVNVISSDFWQVRFNYVDEQTVWHNYYYPCTLDSHDFNIDPRELVEVRFVDIGELAQLEMPFDHKQIIQEYLSREP